MAIPVVRRDIADTIEAVGTTQANESITVTAKVTDTVSAVRFSDGEFVQADEILVELTDSEQQALLREAEADVEDAQTQLKRLEDLLTRQSIPASEVDIARARYNGTRARYQSILARLEDRLIRAPFVGMLGFREVSPGTLVSPGTVITTLDDVSVIKLDFSVAEVYLGALSSGLELVAASAAFPGYKFSAQVQTVGTRIDPVTRTATVRAYIVNDELKLRPGMLMVIQLNINPRSALMVPEAALLQETDQAYVYVVDENNRAQQRYIQTGQTQDGWVEVLSGLSQDQWVITEGTIKMRPNAQVLVKDNEAG